MGILTDAEGDLGTKSSVAKQAVSDSYWTNYKNMVHNNSQGPTNLSKTYPT